MIGTQDNVLNRDRLLAIGPTTALSDYLRARYPDCEVARAGSLLAGIDDLSRHEFRAVIAYVDPDDPRMKDAIAGLRDAAGDRATVLLCGEAPDEPRMQDAVAAGANDYVLWPIEGGELDKALGFVGPAATGRAVEAPPAASLDEIARLNDLLAHLDEPRFTMLGKLADLIRLAMGSEGVTLVADGSAVDSGTTVVEPVLTQAITHQGCMVGRINVGRRARAYAAGDSQKLKHYAEMAALLLAAAKRQRDWRRQAMTDEVSGLYNRRYVLEFLDGLLGRARAERFRVTVLLFDIDDFKTYNDNFGHPAGDDVIRCIGELFRSHCREHDVVARFGGDEFCVVFWDADEPRVAGSTHPVDALTVLGRFREALKSYHCTSLSAEKKGKLTISGGLASYPWDAATTRELIARADDALLAAKRAGKNQVFVFGDECCSDLPGESRS